SGMIRTPSPGYLRLIDEIVMSDVWVVDREMQSISVGQGKQQFQFAELNPQAKGILDEVFVGESKVSEEFSTLLGETSLTAAVPVHGEGDEVIGAVLVHEKISVGDSYITNSTRMILFSTGVAILLVMGLAVAFAKRFIRPLIQMDQMADQLIAGEYQAKTGITQEDELGDLASNLDRLADRLEEAKRQSAALDQIRKDFISNISHELKTPVTVLRSSLEALREGVVSDPNQVREYYDTLCEEVVVLERLIHDLLELTALQNENFPLNKEELSFVDILRDALRSQRQLARDRGIEISFEVQSEEIPFVGDYTRLRQMVITVLNNAIKYSKATGVVRITEEADRCISIRNFGKIISQEEIDNLFQSFYRGKGSIVKGFGLGLAIAKEIATRHGIEIQVCSSIEDGTVFTFQLPK
ncbi:MAG: HAMP domain-containing sensor histidine kinase, partial [Tissierellia bacterium]|nr:HAMP domain-containing sensor histidine kinase [Tissierellia bacterium]